MQLKTTTLLTILSLLSSTSAASPDGAIVPFTSTLPACASLCGPLFDVQGKCTPPNIASVDANCFCTDARLTPFDTSEGTTGVSAVCGSASCTAAADLTAVKNWYDSYCKTATTGSGTTTTSSTAGASTGTATSSPNSSGGGGGQSAGTTWLSSHYKWVIMLVVLFVFIVVGWIGACLLRRRYIRKKEKEIEMKPPVAWGPHQAQSATYGNGVLHGNPNMHGAADGGHYKEQAAVATPADARRSRGLVKNRT